MGLLSKIFGEKRQQGLVVFSRNEILKSISKVADTFNEVKGQEGHQNLVTFLEMSMNLDILALSEQKELTSEAYAYRRGKIDAIRNVLISREQAIANSKKEKETRNNKKPSEHPAKRSYVPRPRVVGSGISD